MQAQHAEFSISRLCRPLEVSRSGSYEWLSRPPRAQAAVDQQMEAKRQHYFGQEGLPVSRRRLWCILAQAGWRCKTRRKFKVPRSAEQAQTIAPNQLNREFTVHSPDTIYVGDITYLPTGEG